MTDLGEVIYKESIAINKMVIIYFNNNDKCFTIFFCNYPLYNCNDIDEQYLMVQSDNLSDFSKLYDDILYHVIKYIDLVCMDDNRKLASKLMNFIIKYMLKKGSDDDSKDKNNPIQIKQGKYEILCKISTNLNEYLMIFARENQVLFEFVSDPNHVIDNKMHLLFREIDLANNEDLATKINDIIKSNSRCILFDRDSLVEIIYNELAKYNQKNKNRWEKK